jgi:uncharacterized protein (DUF1800 family)
MLPASEPTPAATATSSRGIDPDWAWAPYEPDAKCPWDLAKAGHLFRRAAFGADWETLGRALADGPQRTIDRLLRPEEDVDGFNATYDDYDAAVTDSASTDGLRAWWLRRMIHTPQPLLEKMTLFWHNHFATSNVHVKSALLMVRHLRLLRSHALGHYGPLLQAVSLDPATLVGLGAAASRKSLPNENFVRALMGRFSVGAGQFSETDVREAARAFTGLFMLRNQVREIPREHDDGPKQILGQEGDFKAADVVRIVLRRPATPRLLVAKLYRWFISETEAPQPALIDPLAESLAASGDDGYDVGKLVERMLRSNLFFSPVAYRQRIKSPVEFALGIVQGLEAGISTVQLGQDLAGLGQDLLSPPTVKGWPGGRDWINTATVIGRNNLAHAMLRGEKPYGEKLDPWAVARKHGHNDLPAAGRFLVDLWLQSDLSEEVREDLLGAATQPTDEAMAARRLAHAVAALPEFHLA